MHDIHQTYEDRCKEIIKSRGLTIMDLSALFDLDPFAAKQAVTNKGKDGRPRKRLSYKVIKRTCETLEVSADYILGFKDTPDIEAMNVVPDSEFGNKLLGLIRDCNIKQKDVADDIGVDPRVINNWARGSEYPVAHFLVELSSYFGVSLDWLLGLSEVE